MTNGTGLLLKHPDFAEQVRELFEKLQGNETLQSKFIDTPSTVIDTSMYPANESKKLTVSKFIFSTLSGKNTGIHCELPK